MKNTTVWCLNRTVIEPQRDPPKPYPLRELFALGGAEDVAPYTF